MTFLQLQQFLLHNLSVAPGQKVKLHRLLEVCRPFDQHDYHVSLYVNELDDKVELHIDIEGIHNQFVDENFSTNTIVTLFSPLPRRFDEDFGTVRHLQEQYSLHVAQEKIAKEAAAKFRYEQSFRFMVSKCWRNFVRRFVCK